MDFGQLFVGVVMAVAASYLNDLVKEIREMRKEIMQLQVNDDQQTKEIADIKKRVFNHA